MATDPFGLAERTYQQLVEERRRGAIESRAFRSAVRGLAVEDGEGNRWLLGPEDGTWYRRDHDRWVPAEPPRRLVCPHCGHHNLPRHSFCVDCGKQLERPDQGPQSGRKAKRKSAATE